MSNKRQATSDRKNQKGITILIALFLFMLLAIFALNFAQMIVVDATEIAPGAADVITGMGPKKELERLQAMYLAQAGINHIHRRVVDLQKCVSIDPGDDPLCYFLDGQSRYYDHDVAANRTGSYGISLNESTGNYDRNHTILPNLNIESRGYVPDWTTTRTDYDLELDVWRSARAFDDGGWGDVPQGGSVPVNFIDTSGYPYCKCPGANCSVSPPVPGNCEGGLDKDMGQRSSSAPYAPTTPAATALQLGSSFVTLCANGFHCHLIIDFGMEVDFDEIRWLNRSGNYVTWMRLLEYWDSNGMRVQLGTTLEQSFPNPIVTGNNTGYVPYYMRSVFGESCGGGSKNNNKIYNGDKCTNFLGAGTPSDRWFYIPSDKNPCTVEASECRSGSQTGPVVGHTQRSYIARYKLVSAVRARKIMICIQTQTTPPFSAFTLEEFGIYCCGSSTDNTYPSLSRPVLKETHGVLRAGLAYTYTSPGPPVITYLNPNSAAPTNPGELNKESSNYP